MHTVTNQCDLWELCRNESSEKIKHWSFKGGNHRHLTIRFRFRGLRLSMHLVDSKDFISWHLFCHHCVITGVHLHWLQDLWFKTYLRLLLLLQVCCLNKISQSMTAVSALHIDLTFILSGLIFTELSWPSRVESTHLMRVMPKRGRQLCWL